MNTNDGTFSLEDVPVYPGHNALQVRVTDVSGNVATEIRNVTNSVSFDETFLHDANGNLTNWVSGSQNWTFQWDWADRLVKVSSNGVVLLQNWYDANSRRIAKLEVVGGQTNRWLYLYDGWEIVGLTDSTGALKETFTRGVGLAGDIGTLVAVTHHTGSITNGTFYTHHNHRGDIVLVRSGATTTATYEYSAYGKLTTQTGTDLSRFKFSSKERDASAGLSYYGYRFYAPQWQRWVNRDPIGEKGGHNLYSFVRDSPIVSMDPAGLSKDANCVAHCWEEYLSVEDATSNTEAYLVCLHAAIAQCKAWPPGAQQMCVIVAAAACGGLEIVLTVADISSVLGCISACPDACPQTPPLLPPPGQGCSICPVNAPPVIKHER